jgi:hypothetical protein
LLDQALKTSLRRRYSLPSQAKVIKRPTIASKAETLLHYS